MLTLLKIAVTGPISSGKSTVCELLSAHGGYVISADTLVHKLLQTDKNLQTQLNQLLNQTLNFKTDAYREQIADKVFSNTELLTKLENLIHPRVFEAIKLDYQKAQQRAARFFVCEIPLLFETGMEVFFDKLIYVWADDTICKERFTKKTGYDSLQWTKRMNRLSSQQELKTKLCFVITNNTNQEELTNQVNLFLNSLPL